MIPQRFRGLKEVKVVKDSLVQQKSQLIWRCIMYFAVVDTILDVCSNMHSLEKEPPVILFHTIICLLKVAPNCVLLSFQCKMEEIRLTFNYILTSSRKAKASQTAKKRATEKYLLPALLTISVTFPLECNVGHPAISFIFSRNLRKFHNQLVGNEISQKTSWKVW